ncbi:MAG TPA: ABC transporter permease, partial [Candidatus Deferrimicrobiaceae bacterium]
MAETREVVIAPGGDARQEWRDLWRYRELFFFLAWRDLLVRYKQTAIGASWSLLRPLLMMALFTVIFGVLARLPSEGVPYPLFVYSALLPWQLFAGTMADCGNSLQTNSNLLGKIWFPRLLVPASAMVGGLVDFLVSFVFLAALMAWYGIAPGPRVAALPLFLGLALLSAAGLGLWFAALNIRYRDYRFVLPFVVQYGLYASPVGYSIAIIPERWRMLYSINPMAGVAEGFRWALFGGPFRVDRAGFCISVGLSLLILVTGLRHFRRTERTMADF